jgi:hypothetical protein
VQHAPDLDTVGLLNEAHPVIAYAEATLFGIPLKSLDITYTGFGEAVKRCEYAHGGGNVEAADIGAGLIGEGDFLHEPRLTPVPCSFSRRRG